MAGIKRQSINFPEGLKRDLKEIADETTFSVNDLVVMASYSLVSNYKDKGTFIFADLLNPEHRNKK
jgi:hypothetical protein